MTFKDELAANDYSRPASVPCSVGLWRDKQTPVDQREFDEAIAAPRHVVTAVAIHRTMRGMGYLQDVGSVTRHRRKDCLCDIQG